MDLLYQYGPKYGSVILSWKTMTVVFTVDSMLMKNWESRNAYALPTKT